MPPVGLPRARLHEVDALRGVCLLGILVMNMQGYALPHQAYLNPAAWGSLQGADGLAWGLSRLFFDFKFITLFSALFGASLALAGSQTNQRKRLAWLIPFGLLHAYGFFYGDILVTYALVGQVVLFAREWPVARLVGVGVASFFVAPVLLLALLVVPPPLLEDLMMHFDPSLAAQEVRQMLGPMGEQLKVRAPIALSQQTSSLLLETGFRVAGAMLLGMAVVKRSGAERLALPSLHVELALWVSGVLISAAAMVVQVRGGFGFWAYVPAQAIHDVGSALLAFGMGSSLLRAFQRWPSRSLARLGRVALSAYLVQSVVFSLVFGGHGLGLFGSVSRVTLVLWAFGFWALEVLVARVWERQGPMEWAWRRLQQW